MQETLLQNKNILVELNTLEEGLNFLVPAEWWEQLIKKMQNIELKQLKSQKIIQHPLSVLLEMGVLEISQNHIERQLKSINQKAYNQAKFVNSKVEEEKQQQKGRRKGFANFQSLNLGKIVQQTCFDHLLICPKLNTSILQNMMIEVVWRVVSPSLYSLICHSETLLNIQNCKKVIIGIPVFLDSSEIDYSNPNSSTYHLKKQVESSLYFQESGLRKYAMIGSLQYKMNPGKIRKFVISGLNRLFLYQPCFQNQNNRQILIYHKDCFYHKQEYSNDREIVKNQVQLFQCKLVEPFQMIIYIGAQIINIADHSEELLVYLLQKPGKRVKVDELFQAKYTQKNTEIKTFQPTIINQGNSRNDSKRNRFINIIQTNQEYRQRLIETKERATHYKDQHSSTEQDTPSDILQQVLYQDCMRLGRKQDNKIQFPLWRSDIKITSFVKSAELKMNQSIPIPFSKFQGKTVRINGGKRVYVGGRSNKISLNINGQLIQEQLKQQSGSNVPIPEDVLQSLEGLALQILGQKDIELFNKEQAVQLLKDKVDIESQTCKNDMDDLDEAESREC